MLGLMHVLEVVALHLYPKGGMMVYTKDNAFPSSWKQAAVCVLQHSSLAHTLICKQKMSIMIRGEGGERRSEKGKMERCKKKKAIAKWKCVT